MELTNAMVRAAVGQAVEVGLLPRNAAQNAHDWEIMRGILLAALAQRAVATGNMTWPKEDTLTNW
jgi:hypothetical protein